MLVLLWGASEAVYHFYRVWKVTNPGGFVVPHVAFYAKGLYFIIGLFFCLSLLSLGFKESLSLSLRTLELQWWAKPGSSYSHSGE